MSPNLPIRSLCLCAALFVMLAFTKVAAADDDVAACSILEVKASNSEGGIDAALKPLAKKLQKPPFSAWKSFKLLKKHSENAALMKAVSVKLQTGGKLSLLYRDRSDSKGRKPRLRIGFTLDDKDGKRKAEMTIKVDSGDFTLVGRDANKDGSSHILAIRCSVK